MHHATKYSVSQQKSQVFCQCPPPNDWESSLTVKKLCHIKRDHLVKCYILQRKKRKNAINMTDLHKIWHSDTEHVSHVHRPLKIIFFKSKMADGRYVWETRSASSWDIEFLIAMHLRDTFCILPNFVDICHAVVEISQFFAFLQLNLKIHWMTALYMVKGNWIIFLIMRRYKHKISERKILTYNFQLLEKYWQKN